MGVDVIGDVVVTVSRDLGAAMLTWTHTLDATTVDRVGAVAAMHEGFADTRPAGLCPLETRLGLSGPSASTTLSASPPTSSLPCGAAANS